MLSPSEVQVMKSDFCVFGQCLSGKWQDTCQRNLLQEVSGPNELWKQAVILDPFLKVCQVQSFNSYNFPTF